MLKSKSICVLEAKTALRNAFGKVVREQAMQVDASSWIFICDCFEEVIEKFLGMFLVSSQVGPLAHCQSHYAFLRIPLCYHDDTE
jgi:hypothetical protein